MAVISRSPFVALALAAVCGLGCQRGSDSREASAALNDLSRPAFTSADLPDDDAAHDPDDIVVDFVDGTTVEQIDAIEQRWGVDLSLADAEEGVDSAITVGHVDDTSRLATLLDLIRLEPSVEAAEPLMMLKASFQPNDPNYQKQWNLKLINMPQAWDSSRGKGVTVAVLDTGIAYESYQDFKQVPDLKGVKFVNGFDFVNQDSHANDDHGHGTHVAGTIAQATNNGEGVAGVAFEATLMPVKVLDAFGSGNSATISDAIRWAADHGAKVINMSLGGGGRSQVMENAVAYARKKGVVVVCAAGNGGRGVVEYPAAYPASVAVGAVGPTSEKAPYSSFGKELDIAAPGGDKSRGEEQGILQNTIDPRDYTKSIYAYYQGTSMATPHVAAVAALLWANGAKSPDEVEQALFASAKAPGGGRTWSEQYGHGIVDAAGALKALSSLQQGESLRIAARSELPRAADSTVINGSDAVSASSSESSAVTPLGTRLRDIEWRPLWWSLGLLAFVLLTLGRKERPGFLNVLLKPGFVVPLVLTTVGIFFARWLGDPSGATTHFVSLPLPDWIGRIIFGRGTLANPLVYSAALPLLASLFAIRLTSIRPIIGGLSLGFAGILFYSAWAKAPALAWLPFTFLALPWLIANALACLFIARAMLKKERA